MNRFQPCTKWHGSEWPWCLMQRPPCISPERHQNDILQFDSAWRDPTKFHCPHFAFFFSFLSISPNTRIAFAVHALVGIATIPSHTVGRKSPEPPPSRLYTFPLRCSFCFPPDARYILSFLYTFLLAPPPSPPCFSLTLLPGERCT